MTSSSLCESCAAGIRVLFEPDAKAYDRASQTARQEFVRKVRTIAGTFQLLAQERWLWNPARNPLWLETISHKALRLTIPLLHAALLIANMVLMREGFFYQLLMGAQAIVLCRRSDVGTCSVTRAGVPASLPSRTRCA